jgi:hypothetical protein
MNSKKRIGYMSIPIKLRPWQETLDQPQFGGFIYKFQFQTIFFFFHLKNRIFPFLVFLMFWLILSRRTQIYGISFNLRITQIVAGMH